MLEFFVTNFAPGSGGKFVSTVLQASNEIAHWNINVNRAKNTTNFNDLFIEYVRNSFPGNLDLHLKQEPCLPFSFEEFSSFSYRSNDLSSIQVEKLLEHESYIQEIISNNQKLMLVLHKPNDGFLKNADTVTLSIDSKRAKRFAQKALLKKHYKIDQHYILYKKHHPDYCNVSSATLAKKYFEENQPYRNISMIKFLKEEILDPKIYNVYENLFGKGVVSITKILEDSDSAVKELNQAYNDYNLTGFDADLIGEAYNIWITAQRSLL